MADMRQVLEFVLKADAKNAIAGFRGVSNAAGDTQASIGTAAKGWKASMKSAAVAATPWISGAMAAGAAAIKAANRFEELAIRAGQFADATGLSVETASRWIEVAGDVGVEAGTLEAAIGKMSKALATSPQAFSDLGISVKTAKDGSVDLNETLLATIDVINAISNPTEKAAVASKVFGKSWQSLAELIARGSSGIRSDLAGVSSGLVIDKAELEKAKKYRESMDRLSDTFNDLVITIGEELAPSLADMASALASVTKFASPAISALMKVQEAAWGKGDSIPARIAAGVITGGRSELIRFGKWGAGAVKDLFTPNVDAYFADNINKSKKMVISAEEAAAAFAKANGPGQALGVTFGTTAQKAEDFSAAAWTAAGYAKKLAKAETQARNEADALRGAWNLLLNPLQTEQGWIDLQEQFLDVKDAVEEYDAANKRGFKTEEERRRALLKVQGEQNALKQSIIATAQALGNVDPETTKRILFLVDAGELDAALALLMELEQRAKSENIVYFLGGAPPAPPTTKRSWSGGMVDTQGSWVGERGMEWFQPTAAGRIYTAGELGRAIGATPPMSGGNTYVIEQHLGPGTDAASAGRAVVEVIAAYERMAGKGWRN